MYNKLFGKILDSSIWLEDPYTRIVWITLLAAMDQDGYAHFSAIANLAIRAQVPIDKAEIAVDKLMSPDAESGDPEHDGRRIERVPGGFIILNAPKYRDLATRIIQREQTRERVAKYRAKHAVTECNDLVTQSYTEANTKHTSESYDSDFLEFWKIYPRKEDKKKAQRAWRKLTKTNKGKAMADVYNRYDGVATRFIPLPTTYLNGERFNDGEGLNESYGSKAK